ncbi:beta-glucosidase H [Aspergillus bombycis]|uniref:Probable beta-glucosidase H n=1 Tax=Aspergillus bombycis TaxID=109264 RepID=A0A1F8A5Y6_9EURO|nr:beta-glucosidase H [Aspergillus bombycis]OGM47146.1 beta-glucosidase H [Aspergillus bombycis]
MTLDIDYVFSPALSIKSRVSAKTKPGTDFWHTHPIPEFNVPSIRSTDGPNGIRGTKFFAGVPAACLPCGTALASAWDQDLLRDAGILIGKECLAKGAHCWLGPTINMPRSPLGGRGFESFAEDPHLAGGMAAAMITGCESTGVISAVKHFVGNDQEHERRAVDVLVTQRALREIYLRPFQIVARDACPGALMTSYNKINGKHVVESKEMLDMVRQEWKWNPLIMSDWLGTYTTIDSMNAGLDLEMPGPSRYRGRYVESALQARLIKESTIDSRARRVLEFVQQASRASVSAVETGRDYPEDRALNRKLCADSIVLLKNKNDLLPLPKTIKKIALIGSHVRTPAISGGGSASLEPYYAVSLYDAVSEALPHTEILHEVGAYAHKMLPVIDRLLENAVMHFYNEPIGTERILRATQPMSKTAFQLMDFSAPELNRGLFYTTLTGDFTPDVSGVWDFGLTVFGTGTLYVDDELVVDNTTHQTRGTAFFGKGTVQELGSKTLNAGQTYKIRIEYGSANTSPMKAIGVVHFGGGAAHLGACLHVDPAEMVRSAVKAAAEAEYTVLCTGLNHEWESEGFDRPDMDLPPGIDALIASVLEVAAHKTVIVNQSGTPVTMPWADRARGIVQAWYGGNETGHGIADVIFGDVNPSGKLPLSWPLDVKHNPAYLNYASVGGRMLYGEDVYVGYRYYEKVGREVLFPFGHGLSYTTFTVRPDVVFSQEAFRPEQPPTAAVQIKNTGKVAGAQVLQLYISAPQSPTPRPVKELHGFAKVYLHPGEERVVHIRMDKYATSFWDEIEGMWKSEEGVSVSEVTGHGTVRLIYKDDQRLDYSRHPRVSISEAVNMVVVGKQRDEDVSEPVLANLLAEDRTAWYKKPNLRRLYLILFPACMGIEITSGFDSQIINTVQIVYTWNKYFGRLTGDTVDGKPEYQVEPNLKGFLGAAYSLGAILALPLVPWVNQRLGRRWTIMFGSCISLVGAILQGFANGVGMYVVARMLLGFGIPFCIVAGSSLIGELGYPKERPILTSLFNSSYFIGQIVAAAVGLGTVTIASNWAWRIPSLLQIAPAMVQVVFVFFLPESPRYLISKDRHEEAFDILVKYHAEGDRSSVIVRAEIAQIERTIKLELEAAKQTWWDMFRTAGMRRRMFISAFLGLFTQWSGNTLISYYLSDLLALVGITDSVIKSKINIGIACWGLVSGTTLALTAPRFKRRTMYLTCAISLLCVYIGWTISMERFMTTKVKAAAILTIFFIFAYSPAYNLGYNALTYTYLIEIFPYLGRSRGLSWFQFYGRGATFFATYVNPVGLDRIKWRWLLVYCCWLAFEVVFIYFFFPETSGRTLEELSFMFEGKEKANEVAAAVHKQIEGDEKKADQA